MSRSGKTERPKPRGGVGHLFAQPPSNLYGKTSVYLCGNEIEVENFRELLLYQEGKILFRLSRGVLTITGDRLEIRALEQHRIRLRGTVLCTEFSYPDAEDLRGETE